MGRQVTYPVGAARQHQHGHLGQIHLGQLHVCRHGDAVPAGDLLPLQGGEGYGDSRPAQQVGGDESLHFLETGGEKNVYHKKTSLPERLHSREAVSVQIS